MMSLEAIRREIADLDAVSRQRALDEAESLKLEKLIYAERYRDGTRAAPEPPPLLDRVAATIEAMRAEGLEVRAIYLTDADWEEAMRVFAWDEGRPFLFGHSVRRGQGGRRFSIIYSTHGVGRAVRVRP